MKLDDFNLFATLSNALFDNAEGVYTKGINFIDAIAPMVSMAFGVYVLLQCWHYYNKGFDESLMDITKRFLGWIVVIAIAFNAQNIKTIGKMGWELPDSLANVVQSGEYGGNAMDEQFKKMGKEIIKLEEIRDEEYGGWTEVGSSILASALIYGILGNALALCAITFAFYVVAKMLLLIALTFAPLFLASFLFPATRQWGMNWLQTILGHSVTITGYVIVGAIQQSFVSSTIVKYLQNATGSELMVSLFLTLCMITGATIIFIVIVWNVPSMIVAILGGASFSAHAHALGSLANATARTGTAVKNVSFGNRSVGKDGTVTGSRGLVNGGFNAGKATLTGAYKVGKGVGNLVRGGVNSLRGK